MLVKLSAGEGEGEMLWFTDFILYIIFAYIIGDFFYFYFFRESCGSRDSRGMGVHCTIHYRTGTDRKGIIVSWCWTKPQHSRCLCRFAIAVSYISRCYFVILWASTTDNGSLSLFHSLQANVTYPHRAFQIFLLLLWLNRNQIIIAISGRKLQIDLFPKSFSPSVKQHHYHQCQYGSSVKLQNIFRLTIEHYGLSWP